MFLPPGWADGVGIAPRDRGGTKHGMRALGSGPGPPPLSYVHGVHYVSAMWQARGAETAGIPASSHGQRRSKCHLER